MKKINLRKVLTISSLVTTIIMTCQTFTLSPTIAGRKANVWIKSENIINIDDKGLMTVEANSGPGQHWAGTFDWEFEGPATVELAQIQNKKFEVIMKGGGEISTDDTTYGEIIAAGGFDRNNKGYIGIRTPTNATYYKGYGTPGVDKNEGMVFGFNLTNFPTNVKLQLIGITIDENNAGEQTTIIATSSKSPKQKIVINGDSNGKKDVSSLNLIVNGGTTQQNLVTIMNSSEMTNSSIRVGSLTFKIIKN